MKTNVFLKNSDLDAVWAVPGETADDPRADASYAEALLSA